MYEGLFFNISIDDDLLVRKAVRRARALHFGKLICLKWNF